MTRLADRFAAALPLVAILLSHLWLMPLWDGMEYAQCVTGALQPGHPLVELNCFGHVTFAYAAPLALAVMAKPGSYVPFLIFNALLGALGIAAFLDIAVRVLPGAEWRVERLLAAVALSIAPPFVSAALNLTPDYAVCVFFLFTVAALLRENALLVALAGTLLVLGKETGIALYGLTALAYLVVVRRKLPTLREALLGAVPLLAFVLVRVWQAKTRQGGWAEAPVAGKDVFRMLVRFSLDRHVRAYLFVMFAFQFLWIASLLSLGLVRRLRDRRVQFVLALLVALTYVGTRFVTYLNVRYVVYVVPALLLCALIGVSAAPSLLVRRTLLSALLVALAVSLVAPVDPLSRGYFGTFAVGSREFFRMTSATGEPVGFGRDQLVYNLQFVAFDRLLDQMLRDTKPDPSSPVVIPASQDWFILQQVDPVTHERTLTPDPSAPYITKGWDEQTTPVPTRPWVSTEALRRMPKLPAHIHFVAFPNTRYREDLGILSSRYDLTGTRSYEWRGYFGEVADLTLR